jgi:hypothetical protein
LQNGGIASNHLDIYFAIYPSSANAKGFFAVQKPKKQEQLSHCRHALVLQHSLNDNVPTSNVRAVSVGGKWYNICGAVGVAKPAAGVTVAQIWI